jgi:hypothetical protein
MNWAGFEAAAPDLAAAGRGALDRDGIRQGLLGTVRGDEPPRIHPVYVEIVDGRLYVFLLRSAKRVDLEQDGRFALHAHLDPAVPTEFMIRGRAIRVDDADARAAAARAWSFEIDDSYELFELTIDSALVGLRSDPDEWPPRYTSWTSENAATVP